MHTFPINVLKSTNCISLAASSCWNSMFNTFSVYGPEGKEISSSIIFLSGLIALLSSIWSCSISIWEFSLPLSLSPITMVPSQFILWFEDKGLGSKNKTFPAQWVVQSLSSTKTSCNIITNMKFKSLKYNDNQHTFTFFFIINWNCIDKKEPYSPSNKENLLWQLHKNRERKPPFPKHLPL